MSEVQDACQIVLVSGKGAYWMGKITVKLGLGILKLLNTIYLAKWHGKAGLNRFRNIKGDNYLFVNVNSEDKIALKSIEKELKKHGILFARMPDLCGGDGRTQYVISPSDAAKFKSFLIDHNEGKTRDIKVGTISAEDYRQTGFDLQGNETPEMKDLRHSAEEEMRNQKREAECRETDFRVDPDGNVQNEREKDKGQSHSKVRNFSRKQENRKNDEPVRPGRSGKINYRSEKDLSSKVLRYNFIRHDEQVAESGDLTWVFDKPFEKQNDCCMFEMRDGEHMLIVPETDHYILTSGSGPKYRTAIYSSREYNVYNMSTGELQTMKGAEVAEQMQKPDIHISNSQLRNRYKNTMDGKEWSGARAAYDIGTKAALEQEPVIATVRNSKSPPVKQDDVSITSVDKLESSQTSPQKRPSRHNSR